VHRRGHGNRLGRAVGRRAADPGDRPHIDTVGAGEQHVEQPEALGSRRGLDSRGNEQAGAHTEQVARADEARGRDRGMVADDQHLRRAGGELGHRLVEVARAPGQGVAGAQQRELDRVGIETGGSECDEHLSRRS